MTEEDSGWSNGQARISHKLHAGHSISTHKRGSYMYAIITNLWTGEINELRTRNGIARLQRMAEAFAEGHQTTEGENTCS